ncbi:hypothetical protein LTR85_012210 [Meristemomyces frigidus]|nr:hypothetical protein LTR85_012210 [Meristemomyces frigidus]
MESQNGNSSTAVMEPIKLDPVRARQDIQSLPNKRALSISRRSLRSNGSFSHQGTQDEDRNETLPSPTIATEQLERWNYPRSNIYRVFAVFWAFLIMGANDATYGAIIPYLEEYYHLSYLVVSLIFLSPFVGYNVAAILNNTIHLRLGQRGVAFLAPLCHLVAYVVITVHPPYPVLVVVFILADLGNGLEDSGWNAWIGAMANANECLGFVHAFYGLGATIAPLIATTMITQAGLPWYNWYYVMIGGAAIELGTSVHSFWPCTGAAFRESHPRTSDEGGSRLKEAILKRPAARVTWLCAFFLLGYVGIEVALGGWIVTFMIRVRHGAAFARGMTATGFWLGVTVGRLVLGFVTPRIGEKLAIAIYLPIALGLELLFWLVPQFYVSAVAVALQGFFLGPMFPAAMVACTKLFPKHLHVSGVGFAAAFGGSGGAIFPFAVGAIAQKAGVQVLQPIVVALLAVVRDAPSAVLFNVRVFAIAEKYFIKHLQTLAARKFETAAERNWGTDGFADAIYEIYEATDDSDSILRSRAKRTVMQHASELFKSGGEFGPFLYVACNTPTFAAEIAQLLTRRRNDSPAISNCPRRSCNAAFKSAMAEGETVEWDCLKCRLVATKDYTAWQSHLKTVYEPTSAPRPAHFD